MEHIVAPDFNPGLGTEHIQGLNYEQRNTKYGEYHQQSLVVL
jgi:hypothetical protein